jgi:acetyl-CoA C-acetyltransferase
MAARSRSAIRSAPAGTRLMATLVHALHARGGRYGLQTMCEGGGQANVTIVEAL